MSSECWAGQTDADAVAIYINGMSKNDVVGCTRPVETVCTRTTNRAASRGVAVINSNIYLNGICCNPAGVRFVKCLHEE